MLNEHVLEQLNASHPTLADGSASEEGDLREQLEARTIEARHAQDAVVTHRARIVELEQQNARLRAAVLNQCGDNLCHLTESDIAELKLDKGKIPPQEEFLESCRRFHAQMAGASGVLEGKTIAQLEEEIAAHEAGEMQLAEVGNQLACAEVYTKALETSIRDLCACLNAAIRIVRTPGLWEDMKADQHASHWAEQVKQGMALLSQRA